MLGPNYNYDLEKQRLDNRLQIINAMQAQSLKPMELPTAGAGQTQARMSPLAALIPMVQAYAANKARDNVSQKQADLGEHYKQDLVNGMQDFYSKSSGGWDHNVIPASGEDSNADISQVNGSDQWDYRAPDMKGAITGALASNHPVLQQMGQAGLASMYKTDPMSQLLGTGAQQSGPTPPQSVLDSGNYTVGGQAPTAGGQAPTGAAGAPAAGAGAPPGPGASTDQKLSYYFPMVPPEQARALLAADPTGKTLAEENAHRGRPVVAGENILTPTGPGAFKLPEGVIPARTAVKQADAGVEDSHTLVDGADPTTGAPIKMTRGQAIERTGAPVGNGLLDRLTPDQRAKVMAYAQSSGESKFNVNFNTPNGVVRGTVDLNARGGTQGFQSGQAPAVAAEQRSYGESLAKQRDNFDTEGETAMNIKAKIHEMRDATMNFQSGATAPLKEKLGGIAVAMGMDPADVDKRLGSISSMQIFNKEATQLAFDQVKSLGTREAAVVVERAIKANANANNQPVANKAMMDIMEGVADWKLERQSQAQVWAEAHGGSIQGFQTYYNKTNPITKYVKDVSASSPLPMGAPGGVPSAGKPPPAAPIPTTQPVSLDDYLKSHGIH